jgi:hypothetical protein
LENQKSWARGAQELRIADLFMLQPEERRTILVRPHDLGYFEANDPYVLHLEGTELHVYAQQRLVGVSVNAPQSVLDGIRELGGETLGMLHEVRAHSGLVDMAVSLRGVHPTPETVL